MVGLFKCSNYISSISSNKLELVRFIIVGAIAAIIHYIVFLLILLSIGRKWNEVGIIDWKTNIAYTAGYILSFTFNLFLTSRFTFKKKITMIRSCLFFISHGVNYIIHKCLFNFYLFIGIDNWILLPLVLIVAVPINFMLVRTTFKHF